MFCQQCLVRGDDVAALTERRFTNVLGHAFTAANHFDHGIAVRFPRHSDRIIEPLEFRHITRPIAGTVPSGYRRDLNRLTRSLRN